MTRQINVDDILKLVEFELTQQYLPQDDISEAIQRLHKFQTHWYSEILNKGKAPKIEEVVHALFNANQTMIMLIQTISSKFEATQLELMRLKQFIANKILGEQYEDSKLDLSSISYIKDYLDSISFNLANINTSYNLSIQMQRSNIPIIGTLLNRIRAAFHQLVYFYMNRYVSNQNSLNEAYKKLIQDLVYLNSEYIKQLQILTLKLEELTKEIRKENS